MTSRQTAWTARSRNCGASSGRIRLAILSVLLLSVAIAGFKALARAQERPPNFVLMFLDDSGWSDTSVYGQAAYQTPNIDRLAREGNRFTNFYVPQAIC